MEFKIENGPVFTTLKISLRRGENIRGEAGAMVAMTPSVTLEAKSAGKGFLGTMKAAIGGESFFASLFTAEHGDGEILLAPAVPGDIINLNLENRTLFAQSGAYLAGSSNLSLSTQGSLKAMVSGEGLFLQKISGTGQLFLNSYGAIIEKSLAPGEMYVVDTGHLVAFEESVTYRVKTASKGIFSSLATGEGLVCEYTGPGKIWIQTRNIQAFANLISKLIPGKSS
jgi:uncharacterized protein (TIGR00266 family)